MIRDYYILIIKEMSANQVGFSLQNSWSGEILGSRRARKKPRGRGGEGGWRMKGVGDDRRLP